MPVLLAFLLLPAPHKDKPEPFGPGPLRVRARPLPLNAADPGQRDLGPLHYLGGWQLSSAHHGFGGISSLLAEPDGQLLALSDSGTLMGFHVGSGRGEGRPFIAPLPLRTQASDRPGWHLDSETPAQQPKKDREG